MVVSFLSRSSRFLKNSVSMCMALSFRNIAEPLRSRQHFWRERKKQVWRSWWWVRGWTSEICLLPRRLSSVPQRHQRHSFRSLPLSADRRWSRRSSTMSSDSWRRRIHLTRSHRIILSQRTARKSRKRMGSSTGPNRPKRSTICGRHILPGQGFTRCMKGRDFCSKW